MNAQEPKPVQQPFFVRFLEQQQVLAVQTDVKAGRPVLEDKQLAKRPVASRYYQQ